MKKEYSYGAAIYRIEKGRIEYVIEYMSLGHISLPKGHIEENETIADCVKREVKEELNLEIDLDLNKSNTITYSPKEGVIKDVTFFTALALSSQITPDGIEVKDAKFYSFEDAYNLLTYDSDKQSLKILNEYIKRKNNLWR